MMGDLPPLTDPKIAEEARRNSRDWTDWDGPNPLGAFQFPLEDEMYVPSFRDSKRALEDFLAEHPERAIDYSPEILRSFSGSVNPVVAAAVAAAAASTGPSNSSNEPAHKRTKTDDPTAEGNVDPVFLHNPNINASVVASAPRVGGHDLAALMQTTTTTTAATATATVAATIARPQTPVRQTAPANNATTSRSRGGRNSRGNRSTRQSRSVGQHDISRDNGCIDPTVLSNNGPGPSVPSSPTPLPNSNGGHVPIWTEAQIENFTGRNPNADSLVNPMVPTHMRAQSASAVLGQGQLPGAASQISPTAEMVQATAAVANTIMTESTAGVPQDIATTSSFMTGTNVSGPAIPSAAVVQPVPNAPMGAATADAATSTDQSGNPTALPMVYLQAFGDQADIFVNTSNNLVDRIISAVDQLRHHTSNAHVVHQYCITLRNREAAEKEWNIYQDKLRTIYICVRESMWSALLALIRGVQLFFRRFGNLLDTARHNRRSSLFHRIHRLKIEIVNYRFPHWADFASHEMHASGIVQQAATPGIGPNMEPNMGHVAHFHGASGMFPSD